MIDARFAVGAAMLIAFAAVPTGIHTYGELRSADGLSVSAVPERLAGNRSTPGDRKRHWVHGEFASLEWVDRVYRVGTHDVRLFAVRSYDWKRLYHHPENALVRGSDTRGAGIIRVGVRSDVPLHRLAAARSGRTGTVVYALHAGGRYIENPITFQLQSAPSMLFRGKKPMTLFLASDWAGSPERPENAPAVGILLAALESFERSNSR